MYGKPLGAAGGVLCSQSKTSIPASARDSRDQLSGVAKALQTGVDSPVEVLGLGLLLPKMCHQPCHLRLQGLAIIFGLLDANVAAWCEHVPMPPNIGRSNSLFSEIDSQ